jgi:hypothetical protein
MRIVRLSLLVLLALLAGPSGASSAEPTYDAADPGAKVVSMDNLSASERFWPYQLELTSPWQPEGRSEPLPAGILGVLVRIEASGLARIDFGRDGRFEVPVDETDLLKRANEIRLGKRPKIAPNLVHAIGPRLVDAESPTIRALDFGASFEPTGFLAVFADPNAEGFAALATALTPLRNRHGVMTVLFPQGMHPDPATRDKLRALAWPVPFLMDQYGEGYTASLRGDGAASPGVMLLTREGRVIFQGPWREGTLSALTSALDGAFGNAPVSTTKAERKPAP